MKNKKTITALITGALTLASSTVSAHEGHQHGITPAEKEKCYGIARVGHNDCSAKGHSCAGHAETDNDPEEWVFVEKGTCAEQGGKLK